MVSVEFPATLEVFEGMTLEEIALAIKRDDEGGSSG
jgi:hypothetical protein